MSSLKKLDRQIAHLHKRLIELSECPNAEYKKGTVVDELVKSLKAREAKKTELASRKANRISAKKKPLTERWWFTFGTDHPDHSECYVVPEHSKCYVVIEGTFAEARAEMIRRFGLNWSHQYPSAKMAGVKRWSLKEIVKVDE